MNSMDSRQSNQSSERGEEQDDDDRKPAAAVLDSLEDTTTSAVGFLSPPPPAVAAAGGPSSVHGEAGDHIATIVEDEPLSWNDDDGGHHHHHHPRPHKPELTLKEKLVMRERQRRIETERARLKRQFLFSSNSSATAAATGVESRLENSSLGSNTRHAMMNDNDHMIDPVGFPIVHHHGGGGSSSGGGGGEDFLLGERDHDDEESMRAHPDEDGDEAATESLGFNMERFLRNSDTFHPPQQLEPPRIAGEPNHHHHEEKGVLMERFLKDVVTPHPPPPAEESATMMMRMMMMEEDKPSNNMAGGSSHRSVSFDMDSNVGGMMMIPSPIAPLPSSLPVIEGAAAEDNAMSLSMMAEASSSPSVGRGDPDGSLHVEAPSSVASSSEGGGRGGTLAGSTNTDEPRMLRLTEADMLEMASIDEASIGNAPPSDRDEALSEIGELAEFTAAAAVHHQQDRRIGRGGGSHDTPTTVLESSSQLSGGDYHSQGHVVQSVSSSTDRPSPPVPNLRHDSQSFFDDSTRAIAADDSSDNDDDDDTMEPPLRHDLVSNGLVDLPPHASTTTPRRDNDSVADASASVVEIPYANRPRRHQSISPETIDDSVALSDNHSSTIVDGFDYDKDAPGSPHESNALLLVNNNDDSYNQGDNNNNPMDNSWCVDHHQMMHVSPLHSTAQRLVSTAAITAGNNPFPNPPFYGAVLESSVMNHHHHHSADDESAPLLLGQKTTATASILQEEDSDIERYMAMNVKEVAFLASSSDPVFASVTALGSFVSGIVTAAVGQAEAHLFGMIFKQCPTWERLVDRVFFNLIGCIVFMGLCILLLPEGDNDLSGLSCPFG
jgi:hypothetical protein